MELDEFVRATLTQIINGVDLAKKDHPDRIAVRVGRGGQEIVGKGVHVGQYGVGFLVDFDVEVTAATKGGGKLSIGMAGFGGGGEASKESSHSNRIRFSVPIDYQTVH
ncbi:hypothetical protein HZ994_09385 [Akkermansiaceae bacterium]|nr:hypothetical protein HZ994_09385 [Akkermansiaceae bacterium]